MSTDNPRTNCAVCGLPVLRDAHFCPHCGSEQTPRAEDEELVTGKPGQDSKTPTNPYPQPDHLARLVWETEMVADRYSNGDIILIRTRSGWRGFFGHFNKEDLVRFENTLDQRFPSYESMLGYTGRMPNLIDEFHHLLENAMDSFAGYYPMKLLDELEQASDA